MSIVVNDYKNQHKIEISQEGHFPVIKLDGNRISNLCSAANLDLSVECYPTFTCTLCPTVIMTEINGLVEFKHENKIYRLIDIREV